MSETIKYIVDDKGHKISVLVSLQQWDEINDKYAKLQNKVKILTGIRKGLQEVRDAKATGKKLQSLKDFLNESNR